MWPEETQRKTEQLWKDLSFRLLLHLSREREEVFPLIREFDIREGSQSTTTEALLMSLQNKIYKLEEEHDAIYQRLLGLKNQTDNYNLQSQSSSKQNLLSKLFTDFQQTLLLNVHLENTILFPASMLNGLNLLSTTSTKSKHI
jgi:iron-sulfur cluster repair protein YtfE (RIC family)